MSQSDNQPTDDDIPDLESVCSSEYVDDSDEGEDDDKDRLFIPNLKHVEESVKPETEQMVKKWMESFKDSKAIADALDALKSFICSPFLYGDHVDITHWTTKWLPWFQKEGLPVSSGGNMDTLSWNEIMIVDIIDVMFEWLWKKKTSSVHMNVGYVIELWDKVKRETSVDTSLDIIRRYRWYQGMLAQVKTSSESFGFQNGALYKGTKPMELCCLYGCCYAGFKIRKIIESNEDIIKVFHKLHVSQQDNYRIIKSNLDQAEQKYLFCEDFNRLFLKVLNSWPFNVSIHESRAMCHLGMMQMQPLISDLYRILLAVRSHKMALLYMIKTLHDVGQTGREKYFEGKFLQLYPDDQTLLTTTLEGDYDKPIAERTATGDEFSHYQKLKDFAVKGSKDVLQESYESAQAFFRDCLKGMDSTIGWQASLPWDSAMSFVIGVKFGYSWTFFKMKKYDRALEEFQHLQKANIFYPLSASHYYTAQCYLKLRRFNEANNAVNEGIYSFDIKYRRTEVLFWPGTKTPIQECNQYYVKNKLLQLKAQLSPNKDSLIATCPFATCLHYNISRQIDRDDKQDFKGYTCIRCSEKCMLGYHPSCWRRYKVANPQITNEKAFLGSPCITPDCPGHITYIAVFETADKPKFEAHLDGPKHSVPSPTMDNEAEEDMKPSNKPKKKPQIDQSKKLPVSSSSNSSSSSSLPATSTQSNTTVDTQTGTPTSMAGIPTGAVSSTVTSNMHDSTVHERPLKIDTNATYALERPDKQDKLENSAKLTEDSRKVEDSVSVINKLAEEDSTERKSKSKKKKKKKTKAKKEQGEELQDKTNTALQCYDMFNFDRHSADIDEEPQLQPPSSSVNDQQPLSQESTESSTVGVTKPHLPSDHDWLLSYFVETFKINGPMHPMDPLLIDSLQILPEDNQKIIDSYGGIGEFLMHSSIFQTYENGAKIGLKQDRTNTKTATQPAPTYASNGGLHEALQQLQDQHQPQPPSVVNPVGHPSRNNITGSDVLVRKEKNSGDQQSMLLDMNEPGLPTISNISGPKDKRSFDSNHTGVVESFLESSQKVITSTTQNPIGTKGTGKIEKVPMSVPNHENVTETAKETKSSVKKDVKTSNSTGSVLINGNGMDLDEFEQYERPRKDKLLRSEFWPHSKGLADSVANWRVEPSLEEVIDRCTVNVSSNGLTIDNLKKPSSSIDWKNKPIGPIAKGMTADHHSNDPVAMVNTEPTKVTVSKGVNTDSVPQFEKYRDKYYEVLKEKQTLVDKLEASDDKIIKVQKQYNHDLELVEKKAKHDYHKELEKKESMLKEKMKQEKERETMERRGMNEHVKALKNELKASTEKLSKAKQEFQDKEREKMEELARCQEECERLKEEKANLYRTLFDQCQHLLQRSCEAEILVLNTRRESVMKTLTARFQELEKLCSCAVQTVQGGEPELLQYRDQCKAIMDNYQTTIDDQIKLIQTGTELNKLEQIIPPVFPPIGTSLRLKIQQTQRNMMLLQRKLLLQQQQQQQQQQMMTQPLDQLSAQSLLDPVVTSGGIATVPPSSTVPSSSMELLQQAQQGQRQLQQGQLQHGQLQQQAQHGQGQMQQQGQLQQAQIQQGQPRQSLKPNSMSNSASPVPSNSAGGSVTTATTAKKPEGKNTASFDYLVNLLSPQYPSYTRDDFKSIITQLRKSGSLNGLPMDVIVKKVKELIEQKENMLITQQQQQQHVVQPSSLSVAGQQFTSQQLPTNPLAPSSLTGSSLSQLSLSQSHLPTNQAPFPSAMGMPLSLPPPMFSGPTSIPDNLAVAAAAATLSQMSSSNLGPVPTGFMPPQPTANYYLQQQEMMQSAKQILMPPKAPPPMFSEVEYNEDNNCIICYEDMLEHNSIRLECGHRFHKTCIRSWLNEQNTCPTCRNHALLPEDFPHLH